MKIKTITVERLQSFCGHSNLKLGYTAEVFDNEKAEDVKSELLELIDTEIAKISSSYKQRKHLAVENKALKDSLDGYVFTIDSILEHIHESNNEEIPYCFQGILDIISGDDIPF